MEVLKEEERITYTGKVRIQWLKSQNRILLKIIIILQK